MDNRTKHHDTIVIGGGQAGLVTGYYLKQQGRDLVILDGHDRVGDNWRERWDTLELFTNAGDSQLPGLPFPAPDDHLPTKDEMGDYLEAYAKEFDLPVRSGVWVETLSRSGGRYRIETSSGVLTADRVVVATGACPSPKIPAFAKGLDPSVQQMHSSDYQRPRAVNGDRILVVGAGSSGTQIALDLMRRKDKIWLAGRYSGYAPRRLLGFINTLWVVRHTLMNVPVDTPLGKKIARKLGSHGAPVFDIKESEVIEAGIERLPRLSGVRAGKPVFEDGTMLEVDAIVWATGFRQDFGWIDLDVFREDGLPRHYRGVVGEAEGLYFVGLPFLHKGRSLLITDVWMDASYIVEQIERAAPMPAPARKIQPLPAGGD